QGFLRASDEIKIEHTDTGRSGTRALLRAQGKSIRVNGVAVPSVLTIFSGDRIETGADTAASIISSGRILTLDRNSSAVFQNGTLAVNRGKAWLGTQNGTAPGTITKLAAPFAAPATVSSTTTLTVAAGNSNDHFTDICAQFPQACDQAEDACE